MLHLLEALKRIYNVLSNTKIDRSLLVKKEQNEDQPRLRFTLLASLFCKRL